MVRFEKLTIKDIRKETSDCVSIAFEVPEDLKNQYQFKQGQNLTLRLMMNKEELRRSYSICSSPLDNELRIAVKKTVQGRFSSHANLKLRKGDIVEVLPPPVSFIQIFKLIIKTNTSHSLPAVGLLPLFRS